MQTYNKMMHSMVGDRETYCFWYKTRMVRMINISGPKGDSKMMDLLIIPPPEKSRYENLNTYQQAK
jgi:hypothetical protein